METTQKLSKKWRIEIYTDQSVSQKTVAREAEKMTSTLSGGYLGIVVEEHNTGADEE